jgi:hypothetical protein
MPPGPRPGTCSASQQQNIHALCCQSWCNLQGRLHSQALPVKAFCSKGGSQGAAEEQTCSITANHNRPMHMPHRQVQEKTALQLTQVSPPAQRIGSLSATDASAETLQLSTVLRTLRLCAPLHRHTAPSCGRLHMSGVCGWLSVHLLQCMPLRLQGASQPCCQWLHGSVCAQWGAGV